MSIYEDVFSDNPPVLYDAVRQHGLRLSTPLVQRLLDENCMEYDRELVQRDMLTPEQQTIVIYRPSVHYSNLFDFASNPKTSSYVLDSLWDRLKSLPESSPYQIIGKITHHPNVSIGLLLNIRRSPDWIVRDIAYRVLIGKKLVEWKQFLVGDLVSAFPGVTVSMPVEWLEELWGNTILAC